MMTSTPIKKVRSNTLIVLTEFIIFALIFTVVKLFSWSDAIWQAVFFVLAIVLCELMTKYFLPIYIYCFDQQSFIINKTLGKKTVTVCNIDTDKIVAIYTRDGFKKQKIDSPKSIYNYNANVVTSSSKVLVFRYSDCTEAVVFEPSDEMYNSILALTENR